MADDDKPWLKTKIIRPALPIDLPKSDEATTSQGPGQGAFGGNATIDPVSGAEIPPPETATAGEGSQQVARGASMVGDLIAHPRVDTSIKPGPNVADMLPLSQDPASGRLSFALPNPVRAMLTEGPQIDHGQLRTPAVTTVPGD